ncbi:MAG TPA: hypothetical protein P5123_07305 [Spirochaetota bacterium]|nr:hypothetical protein [Spirochaetota bacterium]
MKLKEYKNLSNFLNVLFDFFKENNLTGNFYYENDTDKLKNILLESQFVSYNLSPFIDQYSIDFKTDNNANNANIANQSFVEYIIFGSEHDNKSTGLLIDVSEKGSSCNSFFQLSWYEELFPPFVYDFFDSDGMLTINHYEKESKVKIEPKEIMSFDDFEKHLKKNRFKKNLNVIDVE